MKLICLNIWGGTCEEELLAFIKEHASTTDFFCFQEVFSSQEARVFAHGRSERKMHSNIFEKVAQILPEHNGLLAVAQEGCEIQYKADYPIKFGLATFVRKTLDVEHGDIFVHRFKNAREEDNTTIGKNLQYITFTKDNKKWTIANVHGLWNALPKTDTPNRIEQSRKIKAFLDQQEGSKILCGDLNLLPTTQSLAMLQEGMIDCIKEHNITTTRSKFYTKPAKFADYTLVSQDVVVHNFSVPNIPISDHLPMILEFE